MRSWIPRVTAGSGYNLQARSSSSIHINACDDVTRVSLVMCVDTIAALSVWLCFYLGLSHSADVGLRGLAPQSNEKNI